MNGRKEYWKSIAMANAKTAELRSKQVDELVFAIRKLQAENKLLKEMLNKEQERKDT